VGKSSLVRAAVEELAGDFEYVHVIGLAGSEASEGWPAVLARALGLPPEAGDQSGALYVVLSGRTLLVLDDAEAAVSLSQLGELVAWCRQLQVVVVTVARLGPLDHLVVEPLGREDAERLFVERAVATVPDFRVDEQTAPFVGRVCEALEGLPLAIELAAARLPALSLALLAREVSEQRALSLLSGADADRVGVRACLEASCEHMGQSGARLFALTGIFEDSFSLEALIAVGGGVATGEVFDDLTRLVDLRLLEQTPDETDGVRYRTPGLVRELARQRLGESGRSEEVGGRHAGYYAGLARSAARDLADARDEGALPLLRRESLQLWAALEWLQRRRPAEALRLAADLAHLADRVGEQDRCASSLEVLLDQVGDGVDAAVRRDALLAAATLGLRSKAAVADAELAGERLAEATALARRLGEPLALLRALSQSVLALPVTRDAEQARLAAKEGTELARTLGHARWRARFETWTGMIAHVSNDMEEAARWGQQGLRRALQAGDPPGIISAGLLLHPMPPEVGVDRSQLPSLQELAAMAERLGDVALRSHLYGQLAAAALGSGDLPGSARWVLRRLDLVVRSAAWHGSGYLVMQTVMIAALRSDDEIAARLHGSLAPMLDVLNGGLPPPYAASYQAGVAAVRTRLGTDTFDRLAADGSPVPWEQVLAQAKPYLLSVAGPDQAPSVDIKPKSAPELTARELLVLAHLVAGRRNKEIATLLGITPKTVMHHSVAIYRKLGVRSRAEAAVRALREQLVPPA
jgi:predicted ATPase/DNA-binding CsgD family transcriptional regulator